MSAIYQIKAQLLSPKVEKIHNLVQLSSLPLHVWSVALELREINTTM